MTKKPKANKIYVGHTRQELRRLQHWFAGFEAAGGKLPPCMTAFDPLQKAICLIDDHIGWADD
jgi:hypothetical protein